MKETAYLLQAALISAWWVGLASSQFFFDAFQFNQIPSTAFWAFFAPDIILIAALSTMRGYQKNAAIEYIILGAFGYASLYCVLRSHLIKPTNWLYLAPTNTSAIQWLSPELDRELQSPLFFNLFRS
ncbi:MAG: hypothetical protein ABL888_18235 [Pirellulaceae bacterium]